MAYRQQSPRISRDLLIAALFTGLLCGLWAGFASYISLNVWAGFAGCTAYFATGKHGINALLLTIATTLVGALMAFLMIILETHIFGFIGGPIAGTLGVGILVATIVLLGSVNWLSFVPGMFVGCYTFFAIDGLLNHNWLILCLSLVAGAILGFACDRGGYYLAQWFNNRKKPTA